MSEVSEAPHCEVCHKLFSRKGKKREYRRRITDLATNKSYVVCNACGLMFRRARHKNARKKKDQETPASKALVSDYKWEDIALFVTALQAAVSDSCVARLYCPVTSPKVCNCIQRFITESKISNEMLRSQNLKDLINKTNAFELIKLYNRAKELIKVKTPRPVNKNLTGNQKKGIIHMRTKEYEDFVLQNRDKLKSEYHFCERAVQRVLCYSNNYLHKQLKSSPNGEARITGKNRSSAESLPEVRLLVREQCCRRRCTRLVSTERRSVERWRHKALLGRKDAKIVVDEMLTPMKFNGIGSCSRFIQLVTGCTKSFCSSIKRDFKRHNAVKNPSEHGLYEYWRRKKSNVTKSCIVNDEKSVSHPSVITRNICYTDADAVTPLRTETQIVTEVPCTDNNFTDMKEQNVTSINSTSDETSKKEKIVKKDSDSGAVQNLSGDITYIEHIRPSCLQSEVSVLSSLNLSAVQSLPSDVVPTISTVHLDGNGCDRITNSNNSNEIIQCMEITQLSDLDNTMQNEDETLKNLCLIPLPLDLNYVFLQLN